MNPKIVKERDDGLLKGKKLLIFDFDGTLADTNHLHAMAFAEVFSPFGVKVDYQKIAGLRTSDAIVACFEAAGFYIPESRIKELTDSKQAIVRGLIKEKLKALPGVDNFLRAIRSNFKCALYSSGSRGTVTIAVEKLGYSGWFDPMLCAEDVACAKPDPEGYLRILSLTGCKPEDALVFEDSDVGIRAAQNAGLMTCDVRFINFDQIKTEYHQYNLFK